MSFESKERDFNDENIEPMQNSRRSCGGVAKAAFLAAEVEGEWRSVMDLVDKGGFDIDEVNEAGMTALHYATRRGCKDAVSGLLKRGADANLETSDGNSPLSVLSGRARERETARWPRAQLLSLLLPLRRGGMRV